jgi:hypothetical protein
MKTAIIFSGFFRTFDYVKGTLTNNIMNTLDCDVFFSTPKTMFANTNDEVPEYHNIHSQNDELVGANVIDFFGDKLKMFELRDYDGQFYKDALITNGVPSKNFCDQHTWRILSQLHSTYFSLNIFKQYVESNGINYDVVILARPDVIYHSRLNIGGIQWDKINYPSHAVFEGKLRILSPHARPSPTLKKAFNDQMLIGSQNNILTFHSLYENVMNYFREGIDFNHETMMGVHLIKNKIKWCGVNYITYELCRRAEGLIFDETSSPQVITLPNNVLSARDRRLQRAHK